MVDQLEHIIGQPLAVKQLHSLKENNRIPHAFLFTGPAGVGKFLTAIQFTKLLNDPKNFRKIEKLDEPHVKYIIPLPRGKGEISESSGLEKLNDNQLKDYHEQIKKKIENPYHKIQIEDANIIKISSIREIRKFLSLEYEDIKYRVIIIDDAHLMNTEGQNSLLKSLEEPPDGVIFILLTPYDKKLLPTIHSRCWTIRFNGLSHDDITNILIEKFNIKKEEAKRTALFSNGSVRTALELIENNMSELLESTIQILRFSLGGWFNSAYIEFKHATDEFERSKVKDILFLILTWLNDIQKNKIDFRNYYFEDYQETLQKFNKNFPNANISKIYDTVDELILSMDKNILLNVIILNLILQLNLISNGK